MKAHNEFVLSKQVLKSGTSIGANVEEATAAQTKKDFAFKMAIASKEARETHYWLRLISESKMVHYDLTSILGDCDDLINILTAIVKTTQLRLASQHKSTDGTRALYT